MKRKRQPHTIWKTLGLTAAKEIRLKTRIDKLTLTAETNAKNELTKMVKEAYEKEMAFWTEDIKVDEDEHKNADEMERLKSNKVHLVSSIAREQEIRMKMITESPFYKLEYIQKLETEKATLLAEQNDLKEEINNVLRNLDVLLNDIKGWRSKYDLRIAREDLDRIKEEGKQLSKDYREFQKINDKLDFHWRLKCQNWRLVCINEQLKAKKKILEEFNKLMCGSTRLPLNAGISVPPKGRGKEGISYQDMTSFLFSDDPSEDIEKVDVVDLQTYLGPDETPLSKQDLACQMKKLLSESDYGREISVAEFGYDLSLLEETSEFAGYNIPVILQSTASSLLMEFPSLLSLGEASGSTMNKAGKTTAFILLCAAVNSIESTSYANMNIDDFRRWRDAIDYAVNMGFDDAMCLRVGLVKVAEDYIELSGDLSSAKEAVLEAYKAQDAIEKAMRGSPGCFSNWIGKGF